MAILSRLDLEGDNQQAKVWLESIDHALKEWDSAVKALSLGKTVLLLRKGGIREVGGKFSVKASSSVALSYPRASKS